MFKQVFAQFSDTEMAISGFLIFIFTFLAVIIWTLLLQKKEFYDQLSMMPLKNGDQSGKE